MTEKHVVKKFSSFRKFADIHLKEISPEISGPGWDTDVRYYHIQEYRYYLMFKKILEYFPDSFSRAVDLGCYPGDIGVLLRKIYGDGPEIYGCGLHFTEDFLQKMSGYYNRMLYTELDPENPLGSKAEGTEIDLPSGSVDLIIAGEIFEHLYNPLHFISECSRILSEKGIILLTTDNLKYIGTILGMLRNKTPFSELKESHIFMNTEWRPHERLYFFHEIAELFQQYGLEVKEHFFFDNRHDKHRKLSFRSKINQAVCKVFYLIPSFRNRHFFILQKGDQKRF